MNSNRNQAGAAQSSSDVFGFTIGDLCEQFDQVRWSVILADLPEAIIEGRMLHPQLVPTSIGSFLAECEWEFDRILYLVARIAGGVSLGDWTMHLSLTRTHEDGGPTETSGIGPRPWPREASPSQMNLPSAFWSLRQTDWSQRPQKISIGGERWDCSYCRRTGAPQVSMIWDQANGDMLFLGFSRDPQTYEASP